MLDRPVAFNPVLARISESVTAGLMLSQALYWTRVQERTNPKADGWFYKTQAEWTEEICLSRWEQDGARKILRGLPFWEERKRGAPPKSYFRVDLEKLAEVIAENVEKPHSRLRESITPECGKTSVQSAENSRSLKGTETTTETTQRESLNAARSGELFEETLFSTWWDFFPRKIDKSGCQLIWTALSVLDRAAAFEGLEAWKKSAQWQDEKFIPYPATFLKRRQWESKPAEEAHGNANGSRKASGAITAPCGKYDSRKPELLIEN
jgi:hypothetical protein